MAIKMAIKMATSTPAASSSGALAATSASPSASASPAAAALDAELSLPSLPLFSASSSSSEASHAALLCPDPSADALASALALSPALGPALTPAPAPTSTPGAALEPRVDELLAWLRACASPSLDDALLFVETRWPELLGDLPLLFAWLALVLEQHAAVPAPTDAAQALATRALRRLDASGDLGAVAAEFALQSPFTLLFWKHEQDKQACEARTEPADGVKPRAAFPQEHELLQWLLARRETTLTTQDVLAHVQTRYPRFAGSKSAAALKIWTARFLKRHLAPAGVRGVRGAVASPRAAQEVSTAVEAEVTPVPAAKNTSTRGYVVHSNEFKLAALRRLDEGRSAAEVAQELGLRSASSLLYWRRHRDRLAVADKKRFRLAGGGRHSSCNFEDELLAWVRERHESGQGTDVKAVLEYMRQFHAGFTAGKKEATLRKWVLRFFKRCWRAPSPPEAPRDADKSAIFV